MSLDRRYLTRFIFHLINYSASFPEVGEFFTEGRASWNFAIIAMLSDSTILARTTPPLA